MIAGKIDLHRVSLIVHHTVHKLNGSPSAQIAAADADNHQGLGVPADPIGRLLDLVQLVFGGVGRQMIPAQKIISLAGALGQGIVGLAQPDPPSS